MLELKITPINIEPSTSVKGITKNISDSVAFMLSTANDINRVIAELNETFKAIGEQNNTDELNDRFELISKSLVEISKSIKPAYDDSALIDRVEAIESKEQPAYDDSALIGAIKELNSSLSKLSSEFESIKSSVISIQKETRSNRKEAGFKIDVVEQKINKMTEINE